MKFLESIKEILKQEFGNPLAKVLSEPAESTPTEILIPPVLSGWIVAYRDRCNQLHDGTVSRCEWSGMGWTIHLSNEMTIPLRSVTSVGKTDAAGKVIATWTVREHGHNGEGTGRP